MTLWRTALPLSVAGLMLQAARSFQLGTSGEQMQRGHLLPPLAHMLEPHGNVVDPYDLSKRKYWS